MKQTSALITPQIQETPVPFVQKQWVDENVRKTRYKLWELQDCWHCMIVGTCLALAEVRQLANKAGVQTNSLSNYKLHQLAVENAANSTHPLTLRLQKTLDKKYALQIKHFRSAKDEESLKTLWTSGWKSGQVASSLWALVTHPFATRNIILDVFGEVHMMSHLTGASSCADLGRLAEQERQIDTLQAETHLIKARHEQSHNRLRNQVTLLQEERLNSQRVHAQALAHNITNVREETRKACQQESTSLAQQVEKLQAKLSSAQQALHQSKQRETELIQDIDHMVQLLDKASNEPTTTKTTSPTHNLELCGRCVLYIGGKAHQRRHFQALVESCDGRFLHHDGGQENCQHRISDMVAQADVVMCPIDCISHGAMNKARALCAKQQKPIIFMQRASLSSFAKNLEKALGT